MDVLIVDDEAFIATDLAGIVEAEGHRVIGPAYSLDGAFEALAAHRVDVALLDVDVAGKLVWPLARALLRQDAVPIFISGRVNHPELGGEFAGRTILEKPVRRIDIEQALERAAREIRIRTAPPA